MRKFTTRELEEMYCEMLDEIYGTVKIAGLEYETSNALARLDPVAFRCGFSDWLDSLIGETIFEHSDGEYYDTEEERE